MCLCINCGVKASINGKFCGDACYSMFMTRPFYYQKRPICMLCTKPVQYNAITGIWNLGCDYGHTQEAIRKTAEKVGSRGVVH